MISPDCYLDTKNRISRRVKSNVFWWRFLLYITGQRYDRNSFIDGLSAAINNTIIYKSRPMVVCIRGEAIGSAPFTPGGPGAAAGTCTCYSPLLYYSIHQSIFFYSIVDDGQKVMLIRFVTAVSGSLLFSMIL